MERPEGAADHRALRLGDFRFPALCRDVAEGGLLSQYQIFSTPARARTAESLKLERALSDLVNQAHALTPAEIALMWQTAPPRMPILPPRI
jgi:aryl-alcohol dehydrogenase-like predicted oxidoreductase